MNISMVYFTCIPYTEKEVKKICTLDIYDVLQIFSFMLYVLDLLFLLCDVYNFVV